MPVSETRWLTINEHPLHLGLEFENIPVSDHQIGHLAHLDRPELLLDAKNLSRIEGDSLQRLFTRQTESRGGARVVGQEADIVGDSPGREGKLDPGLVELGGACKCLIVWGVLTTGQFKHSAKNDRNVSFAQQLGVIDRLIAPIDDQFQFVLLGKIDGSFDLAGPIG